MNYKIIEQKTYYSAGVFRLLEKGIADFAGEFYKQGGRVLLIDQVFKQFDYDGSGLISKKEFVEQIENL